MGTAEEDAPPPPGAARATTFSDETFDLPPTLDLLEAVQAHLWRPWAWSLDQALVFGVMLGNMAFGWLALLYLGLPAWFYVVWVVVFRAAYNVGLGLILYQQSETQFLTTWARGLQDGPLRRAIYASFRRSLGPGFEPQKAPPALIAWLCFRVVVDLVLPNDVTAVFFLMFHEFAPITGVLDLVSILFGLATVTFAVWAKASAHKVIGDYAWYWGDFFFLKNCELTFGGVFEMFPHPMYTVAYLWYYGFAFIARNPWIAIVGAGCHLSQLGFLAVVESPHMEKIYGGEQNQPSTAEAKKKGYVEDREPFFVFNLDLPFRSHGLSLVLALFYIFLFHCLPLSRWWFFVHAVWWRVTLTLLQALVLHYQHKTSFFTNHFHKLGLTRREAFMEWKRIYNLVRVVTNASFSMCAVRLFNPPEHWFSTLTLLSVCVAALLFALQLWSTTEAWRSLGPVAWYYGDFFLDDIDFQISYSGIYRFSNHPDSITGFAGLYGGALLSNDVRMLALAIVSHIVHCIFYFCVERPHMTQVYGDQKRPDAALWRTIKANVASMVDATQKIHTEAKRLLAEGGVAPAPKKSD